MKTSIDSTSSALPLLGLGVCTLLVVSLPLLLLTQLPTEDTLQWGAGWIALVLVTGLPLALYLHRRFYLQPALRIRANQHLLDELLKQEPNPSDGGLSGISHDLTRTVHRLVDQWDTLTQQRRQWRALFQSADIGLVFCDTEGRVVEINRAAQQITGWGQQEVRGQKEWICMSYHDHRTNQPLSSPLELILDDQLDQVSHRNVNLQGKQGQLSRVNATAQPVSDGERALGYLVLIQEVGEQPPLLDGLREYQARFCDLQEMIDDVFFEADTNAVLIHVSSQAQRVFGCPAETLTGRTLFELVCDSHREQAASGFEQSLTSERPIEWPELAMQAPGCEERYIHCSAQPLRDKAGRISGYRGLFRDITARRLRDHQLRLAAASFETYEGIMVTDAAGRIVRVNQAFTRITGYSADEVIDRNPRLLKSGAQDTAFYKQLWRQLLHAGHWEGELMNRHKDGHLFPLWESISAVHDQRGEIIYFVSRFIDLSERQQQEQLIRRKIAKEQILGDLLRLGMQELPLSELLRASLGLLLSKVEWLHGENRGALFLAEKMEDGNRIMRLESQVNLDSDLALMAAQVTFNPCYCGDHRNNCVMPRSACEDKKHRVQFNGLFTTRHTCVSIHSQHEVLGALVLFLDESQELTTEQRGFLDRVAEVLASTIAKHRVQAEIEYQAFHDPLTGLPNRQLLLDRLHQDLALARRHERYGAVFLLDLDQFKHLNDAMGHAIGDRLIQEIARSLQGCLRQEDTVARLGGDEFAILTPDLAKQQKQAAYEAGIIAQKLQKAVSRPYRLQGNEYQLTASLGISLFPEPGTEPHDLLRHSDTAMNRAKEAGRNTVRFFSPGMQRAAGQRLRLQNDLRRAIQNGELELHLQPQVDGDGIIIGAESLMRWNHPEQGMIMPGEFIPVAEDSGLIVEIGSWALTECCRWINSCRSSCGELKQISVNVSPNQFRQENFVALVEAAISESGIDPESLELELTENLLLVDVDGAVAKMRQLRESGVRFAIDDFGTGYSSLAYLKALPLDRLKIDQSFVRDLCDDPNDAEIVQTIIAMARSLGLEVMAEGVENEAQLKMLRRMGCQQFQGFRFSRPLPAQVFHEHLQSLGIQGERKQLD